MMRSRNVVRGAGVLALAALSLLGAFGCSKKVMDPNSRPVPEGQQNGQLLMMGWHEQGSFWFAIIDPGTPNDPTDDVLGKGGIDYWADPAGVRTSTFDISQSNELEPFRVGSDGNSTPMFDFLLQPSVRLIGTDLESYDFEDFSPLPEPRYYSRGALNNVVTPASPVSNAAGAFPSSDENMLFVPPPKLPARDSVLDVRFTDDSRAVFYVVEIGDASGVLGTGDVFSFERRLFGIPSPLLPGLRALNGLTLLMPGGSGQTGFQVRLTSKRWPLFFHVRVTAFDGSGRMVNRLNNFLHVHTAGGGQNVETYEPLGGAVEVLDPYPDAVNPVPPPLTLSRDDALAILQAHGGGNLRTVSHLAASGGSGAPAASEAFTDAVKQLVASPMFAKQASDERFRAIRQQMGLSPGAAVPASRLIGSTKH